MEEFWVGVLGTPGTVLSTASLMPQVVHTWRTRSTSDISAAWLVAALVSMVIWSAYGGLINAPALVMVNVLRFVQCAYILFIQLQSERVSFVRRR